MSVLIFCNKHRAFKREKSKCKGCPYNPKSGKLTPLRRLFKPNY
jgi:hypothetical protein